MILRFKISFLLLHSLERKHGNILGVKNVGKIKFSSILFLVLTSPYYFLAMHYCGWKCTFLSDALKKIDTASDFNAILLKLLLKKL